MSAKGVTWWDCLDLVTYGPGRYGVKVGYVYAIVHPNGKMKVGATRNPKVRVADQSWDVRSRAILVFVGKRYRRTEKEFHLAMRQLHYGLGIDIRTETYKPSKELKAVVIRWLENGAPLGGIKEIRTAVKAHIMGVPIPQLTELQVA